MKWITAACLCEVSWNLMAQHSPIELDAQTSTGYEADETSRSSDAHGIRWIPEWTPAHDCAEVTMVSKC